jgi:hypothetical protein
MIYLRKGHCRNDNKFVIATFTVKGLNAASLYATSAMARVSGPVIAAGEVTITNDKGCKK